MDAGSGTLAQLQRHVRLDELDAIRVSHLHADHSADLLTAYYAVLFADIQLAVPIPPYGPPGIADRLAHFLTNTSTRSPVESAAEAKDLQQFVEDDPVADPASVAARRVGRIELGPLWQQDGELVAQRFGQP